MYKLICQLTICIVGVIGDNCTVTMDCSHAVTNSHCESGCTCDAKYYVTNSNTQCTRCMYHLFYSPCLYYVCMCVCVCVYVCVCPLWQIHICLTNKSNILCVYNFCLWTLRMLYNFNFVCLTHIC